VAKSWNKWILDKWIPIFSWCRIISSHYTIAKIRKARISKCQKEFLQTTLEIGQEKKRWSIESILEEHKEQEVSIIAFGIEAEILVLVGKMFQINLQINNRRRCWILSFQRPFQVEAGKRETWTCLNEVMWWCMDLVVNCPEEDGVQRIASLVTRGQIFWI
jgi:hypothetical protein